MSVAEGSEQPFCHLGDDANEALGQRAFTLSGKIEVVGLARLTVADLGFSEAAMPTITEVYQRAERFGLAVCPPEVGPQLRRQYLDQPLGEFLAIAMPPISNYAGEPLLFLLGNGGAGLLLATRTGSLQTRVPSVVEFVFCLPQLAGDP